VSIWDLRELICLRTYDRRRANVRTLSFSYDGRLLAGALGVEGVGRGVGGHGG
jgi:THO complex subunit 3